MINFRHLQYREEVREPCKAVQLWFMPDGGCEAAYDTISATTYRRIHYNGCPPGFTVNVEAITEIPVIMEYISPLPRGGAVSRGSRH